MSTVGFHRKKIKVIYLFSLKKFPIMPPKPRGRPPEKRQNLAGLQNNLSSNFIPSVTSFLKATRQSLSQYRLRDLGVTPIARVQQERCSEQ